MDVATLVGLGVLSITSAYALFYPSKKIYESYNDFKEQGDHKDALKELKEQSVAEAIDRAKQTYNQNGIFE